MPIEIKLPPVTPDFVSGTIGNWTKSVGDQVNVGDIIVEIETDKAMLEVEAEASGTLGRIVYDGGSEEVPVHAVIGYLLEEGESESDIDAMASGAPAAASTPASEPAEPAPAASDKPAPASPASVSKAEVSEPSPTAAATTTSNNSDRIFASPVARRMASSEGVNLAELKGRGPNGRILKADVESHLQTSAGAAASVSATTAQPASAAASTELSRTPHSKMRKVIAQRLTESKQNIPHFYLNVDCNIDELLELRARLNSESNERAPYKLTVNDFIVRAAAVAISKYPEVNSSWDDDGMVNYDDIDISIAVSTDQGLITPIVRKADTKGLATLSNEVKSLAEKARTNKLVPSEYQGGGFSISNLGMYGISNFSAIINPPQSCILAVGAGEKRPVVKGGELAVATMMTLTLSVDHRVVDGSLGALFLSELKQLIENPLHLMLFGG